MINLTVEKINDFFVTNAVAGLFGLDEATTNAAASFIFWLGIFNVGTAINMMLQTALRATGDVMTPLWFLLCSSMLNITFGNVLYSILSIFPESYRYGMLMFCRFMIGMASGNAITFCHFTYERILLCFFQPTLLL